ADFFNGPKNPNFPVSYGFYRSTNGGATWTQNITGLPTTNLNIVAMAVDQTNSSLVYIGIRRGGIFKTGYRGDHWTNIVADLPAEDPYSVAASPLDPSTVYVGMGTNGICKSTDGGGHWTESLTGVLTNGVAPWNLILSLVVHPANDNIVSDGDWYSGVYQTTNGGTSWQLLNTGLSTRAVQSLSISADGIYLYAGTKGEGVFRLQTTPLNVVATGTRSGANLLLNWTGGNSYYVLESSTNLLSSNWLPVLTNTSPSASVSINQTK